MQSIQYSVAQSLRQVQRFLTQHAVAMPAVTASASKRELDAAVAALEAAATEQGSITRGRRGEVRRRAQLERTLRRKYLTPLVKFARASLRGVPEFAALTPATRALSGERLVLTAQGMVVAAEKHLDRITAGDFPADFLEQLRSAAAAVQRSFDSGASGRVRRTGVTKEIREALASGRRAVAALDALVGYTIMGDEALEHEWRAAKRVRRTGTAVAEPAAEAVAGTIVPARTPVALEQEAPAAA